MKYLPTDENVASMADAILDVDYGETLIGPVALIARAAIDHIQHLTPEPSEPVATPAPKPEWRLREPGVLELVGTPITLWLEQNHTMISVLHEGRGKFASAFISLQEAKAVAEKWHEDNQNEKARVIDIRRAFGLDGAA